MLPTVFMFTGCGGPDPCENDDDCGPCMQCTNGECLPLEEICDDGRDNDCDGETDEGCPCTGVVCDTPPPPECADPGTLRVFHGPGACADGVCTYPYDDYSCQEGCQDGRCREDACIGISCDDHNPCTDDDCDPQTGCVHTNNTAACDDQNACTVGDTCSGGSCRPGTSRDCDDGNLCTDDACDAETGCVNTNNTVACDDGDACTVGDTCNQGSCTPGTARDCNDDNPCTDDACDPALGCVHVNNTAPCDDGNACTAGDTCQQGSCRPGTARDCDDGNVCTDDACDAETGCVYTDNNVACDDDNACTLGDRCAQGSCQPGTTRDCDDHNPCTDDNCNQALGCVHANNAASCDDGDLCTVDDRCQDGSCTPGGPADCNDHNPCTDDTCSPALGCRHEPNTGSCDDGDPCTMYDTCDQGICYGAPLDADSDDYVSDACDGNDCNDGDPAVNPGVSEGPMGSAVCGDGIDNDCDGLTDLQDNTCGECQADGDCNDGNLCNGTERCIDHVCQPGDSLACDDDNPCTDDGCDPDSGCTHVNNTAPCDDDNACTVGDVCQQGSCTPGTARDCDDGNPCTDDTCDPDTGCAYASNTASCDDGNACTVGDTCAGGSCQPGPARDCDDDNVCTTDGCDPDTGCTYSDNTASCDDGNACTVGDVCSGGSCQPGSARDCDDDNVCTDDGCDPDSGCTYANNTASCNDGNACTVDDVCAGGSCQPGSSLDCDDDNVCTDDGCDPASGCNHANNTDPCDDGNACTVDDACSGGNCQPGTTRDCDDENVCTDDGCDPASGCIHANNTASCDDDNACTVDDVCSGGSCQPGSSLDCDDDNVCTDDGCDPASGCIHYTNTDPCDDGDPCTEGDQCEEGSCQPGTSIHECSPEGATACNEGQIRTCETGNSGCLEWSAFVPCQDDFCTDATTCGMAPVAELACPEGVEAGDAAAFDASGSVDPDGDVVEYEFDFGDGSQPVSGPDAYASHVYDTEGDFEVVLTVTDDDGATGSDSCILTVDPTSYPDLTISSDTELCGEHHVGVLTIQGGATVTCPEGELIVYAEEIYIDPASAIDLSTSSFSPSGEDYGICHPNCTCYAAWTGGGGGGNGTAGAGTSHTKGSARSYEYGSCVGSCIFFTCYGNAGGVIVGNGYSLGTPPGGMGGMGCGYGGYEPCTDPLEGGMGGGSVRLFATSSIVVDGTVRSNGADGVDGDAASGGGAGGSILVMAPSIDIAGSLSAIPGAGGTGTSPYWSSNYAHGGDGGHGRIKILHGDTFTNTGSISDETVKNFSYMPPVAFSSPTHPDESLAYNEGFTQFDLSWEAPYAGAAGYYTLLSRDAEVEVTPGSGTFTALPQVSLPSSSFDAQGDWYLHVVTVDSSAVVGTISNSFHVQINKQTHTVSSTSHPDQDQWYTQTAVLLAWQPPDGISQDSFAGYWYRMDRRSQAEPGGAGWSFTTNPQVLLSEDWQGQPLSEWTHHFHLVAEDTQGNLTDQAAHFRVQLGTEPDRINFFGYVRDTADAPIEGATVHLEPYGHTTTTNSSGYFLFEDIYEGSYTLTATHPSFQPVAAPVDVDPDSVPYTIVLLP